MTTEHILWFENLSLRDIERVGGKNASLGEMISQLAQAGIRVPTGFATTAQAFREFLDQAGLNQHIRKMLTGLDVSDVTALANAGESIRKQILSATFSPDFEAQLRAAYDELIRRTGSHASFAVRSSATAEDLPTASFAGQQETFLNVVGADNIIAAVKAVFASLFTDRAIAYRVHHGFDHMDVALSAGVQQMVRSDRGASGVMFTLDTESGFPDVVFITSSYGLGEAVVQGAVNPDEFYVYKPGLRVGRPAILRRNLGSKALKMIFNDDPHFQKAVTTVEVAPAQRRVFSITDADIEHLAKAALAIEAHYQRPMDIEWGKDGETGDIFILQARPETVKSRATSQVIERFTLEQPGHVLVTGRSIGQRIGAGRARVIKTPAQMAQVNAGDVLVADMTDPDWEPVMKKASAIVTNRGGRTCHAAIIARELGIPAVVGTGNGTSQIVDGSDITVSCAQGDTGYVYQDKLAFRKDSIDVKCMPDLPVKLMLNVANPDRAFAFQALPNAGIGLARLEFIINTFIGVHPNAVLGFAKLDRELQEKIREKTSAYASPVEYYVEKLTEGIAVLAAAFAPHKVIVRMSDFKSNEYANLLGGAGFEPHEENPMIGFRGCSRYISPEFRDAFALECEAIKRVRNLRGLNNVEIMIPFVRTLNEAREVIDTLAQFGLRRGENGLRVIMMCEVPSNALLAEEFLEYFDGFSIGSNDLTQLTLGLDRDSALVSKTFDERDAAVKKLLSLAIAACLKHNKYIGICGQGPSDHADFAQWLLEQGIQTMSLNPDSVVDTALYLARQK